jgi:hypothetical protein
MRKHLIDNKRSYENFTILCPFVVFQIILSQLCVSLFILFGFVSIMGQFENYVEDFVETRASIEKRISVIPSYQGGTNS